MDSPGRFGASRGDQPAAWFARALVGYGTLSVVGLLLRDPLLQVSAFWPAAGLAAALAVLGWRRSPRHLAAILTAVALGDLFAHLTFAGNLALLPGLLLADVAVPAVFAASFAWRQPPAQSHPPWLDILRFLSATAAAALVGGVIAGITLGLAGDPAWWPQVLLLVAGDASGILLVVPLLLSARNSTGVTRPVEAMANGAFSAAAVAVAFGRSEPAPIAYLVVPGIVWSAVRLGPRWTWATVMATSAAVTYLGTLDRGPFGTGSGGGWEPVLLQQVFLCVVAVMTSLLAAVWRRDAALAEAEHRRREIQRSIDDALPGMMLVSLEPDAPSRIRNANPAMAELLQLDPGQLVGSEWIDFIDRDDRHLAELILSRLAGEPPQPWRGELVHRRADGGRVHALVAAAAVNTGSDRAATVQVLDISEQKAAEAELRHVAQHDQLTGLASRALLSEHVDFALRARARSNTGVALLFVDVDGFKGVNDSFGHACGDELLVLIASRLQATIRPGDVASRIGGDEFAVVCAELHGVGDAERVAARVVDAMAKCFTVNGRPVELGVSVGIAYAETGSTAQVMLREADCAMYAAKRNGKSRWETFNRELHPTTGEGRLELGAQLRGALSAGQLELHYQPLVNLESVRPVAFEALLRWRHPQRGLLSPAAFLDIAAETDLIVEIGTWVVDDALRTAATWTTGTAGPPPRVHVNMAGRQMGRRGAAGLVGQSLERSGVPAGRLIVEVTELSLVAADRTALRNLHNLRALGVGIAVDDYGTGCSTLAQAVTMPVDCIKIDTSVVRDIDRNPRSRALTAAVAGLSRDLGLQCVAEGVETSAECETLRNLGIDSAQGLLFSGPRPATDVPSLLDRPLMAPA